MEDKLKLMNKIRVFFKKDKNNFSSCTYVEEKHWKQKNMCFCLYSKIVLVSLLIIYIIIQIVYTNKHTITIYKTAK